MHHFFEGGERQGQKEWVLENNFIYSSQCCVYTAFNQGLFKHCCALEETELHPISLWIIQNISNDSNRNIHKRSSESHEEYRFYYVGFSCNNMHYYLMLESKGQFLCYQGCILLWYKMDFHVQMMSHIFLQQWRFGFHYYACF